MLSGQAKKTANQRNREPKPLPLLACGIDVHRRQDHTDAPPNATPWSRCTMKMAFTRAGLWLVVIAQSTRFRAASRRAHHRWRCTHRIGIRKSACRLESLESCWGMAAVRKKAQVELRLSAELHYGQRGPSRNGRLSFPILPGGLNIDRFWRIGRYPSPMPVHRSPVQRARGLAHVY